MLPFRGNIEDYDEYLVFEILLTILMSILLPIEQTIFFYSMIKSYVANCLSSLVKTIVSSRTDFEFLRKKWLH